MVDKYKITRYYGFVEFTVISRIYSYLKIYVYVYSKFVVDGEDVFFVKEDGYAFRFGIIRKIVI